MPFCSKRKSLCTPMALLVKIRAFLCNATIARAQSGGASARKLDIICNLMELDESLDLVEQRKAGISRNNAYALLIKCCKTDLECIKRVQSLLVQTALDSVSCLGDQLIRMFASCGCLAEAKLAFNKVLEPSVYTWSIIILAHADHGEADTALDLYQRMELSDVESNEYVYVAVLKACTLMCALQQGRLLHKHIICSGLQPNIFVGSSLVDLYVKCGKLEEAHHVLNKLPNRNVVSWNAMINGYSQNGDGVLALKCFHKMEHEGIKANAMTYSSILKACGNSGDINTGKHIHRQMLEDGLECDVILGSALVDMYAKCGELEEARRIFDILPNQNIVTWGAMIAGYAQHNQGLFALECFENMKLGGIQPNELTFASSLKACGSIGCIEQGKCMHDEIVKIGLQTDMAVGCALVDMYAKCGNLEKAQEVFVKLPNRNVVTWGAMVSGYAQHGEGLLALECFNIMKQEGITPDAGMFTNILNACSRAGLVEEGRLYFKSMLEQHCIAADESHHNCMIDLLAHAGCLSEAEHLLQTYMQQDVVGWTTLLTACKTYNNLELGKQCFDKVCHLDSSCTAAYVLLSNIYAANYMSVDAARMIRLGKCLISSIPWCW